MSIQDDPTWAEEMELSEAEVWRNRALEQLERSRALTKELVALKNEATALERDLNTFTEQVAVAVGVTPKAAIEAFADSRDWNIKDVDVYGEPDEDLAQHGVFEPPRSCKLDWEATFLDQDGMFVVIGGCKIIGGYTVTYWRYEK